MRVLITGVAGFVGLRLARYLLERGETVVGTWIGVPPALAGLEAVEADVLDRKALERAVVGADPEVVVHLAGLTHVGESWKRLADYFQVNVLGTENLLNLAAGRRVLIASSAEVYGAVPDAEQPVAEDRMPRPQSPYALTKAAVERLALERGAVVVRSFNLVGAGQAPHFALPSFARQLARIEAGRMPPVLSVGNLEARRDFLHVLDAVGAYALLAERGDRGGIYNLGSGRDRSIREMLELLREISGVRARVEVDPDRLRPIDVPLLKAATCRLERLGWCSRHTIEAAVEEIWAEARAAVAAQAADAP